MERQIQVLIGLLAVLLFGLALRFLFDPLGAAGQFALVPDGVRGLNSLRGDLGGLFLGGAILLGIGLVLRESLWFLAAAVMMGAIAFGRLVGFVVDGFAGNSVPEFLVELLIVVALLYAHWRSRSTR